MPGPPQYCNYRESSTHSNEECLKHKGPEVQTLAAKQQKEYEDDIINNNE